MKVYKIIPVLFLISFTISIIGCSGESDKDKIIKFYESNIKLCMSEDFKKNMYDEGYMEKKNQELLKESGFKNESEMKEAAKKYENDEEVKTLAKEWEVVRNAIIEEQRKKTED